MDREQQGPWPNRFPFSAYANGWFRVAYSDELALSEVKRVSYFGRELALFRGEDGNARVLDAHCPHLGAHLAIGGCVRGNGIQCPFHHWIFDGNGKCTEVPYAKRIPKSAKIRSWPVDEKNGIIMVHHHSAGEPPSYEIPLLAQVDDPAWSAPVSRRWKVRSNWIDMNENCVDLAHFKYVHGTLTIPTSEVKQEGHIFQTSSRFEQKAPGGTTHGHLVTRDHGPGFQTVEMDGILDTLLVNTATPIDESYSDVVFAYRVKTEGDPRKEHLAKAMVKDLVNQFENDLPIWENKAYWDKPRLCDGDGPVGAYRKWAGQFFA
jgi:nitrite reductase/ring-hydroxylating ferredoxin subunit